MHFYFTSHLFSSQFIQILIISPSTVRRGTFISFFLHILTLPLPLHSIHDFPFFLSIYNFFPSTIPTYKSQLVNVSIPAHIRRLRMYRIMHPNFHLHLIIYALLTSTIIIPSSASVTPLQDTGLPNRLHLSLLAALLIYANTADLYTLSRLSIY